MSPKLTCYNHQKCTEDDQDKILDFGMVAGEKASKVKSFDDWRL